MIRTMNFWNEKKKKIFGVKRENCDSYKNVLREDIFMRSIHNSERYEMLT